MERLLGPLEITKIVQDRPKMAPDAGLGGVNIQGFPKKVAGDIVIFLAMAYLAKQVQGNRIPLVLVQNLLD